MSIYPPQLRRIVVRPTLQHLGLWSQVAEDLLMGTAAVESKLGTYLVQNDGDANDFDDAIGIWQVERKTHDSLWTHFLAYKPALRALVTDLVTEHGAAPEMAWNLRYGCAMARVRYYERKAPLPRTSDPEDLAEYWLHQYNAGGKGSVAAFLAAYPSTWPGK
jgi:hypothetical protein